MADHKLLEVTDLRMHFHTRDGVVKAVDGVSFDLDKGETLGIVGESGSGKSVSAMTLMRLIPMPPGKIEGGEALFKGKSLLTMSDADMRAIRGNEIAMIFQDPMTSLNPVYRVGRQLAEPLRLHKGMNRKQAETRAARAARPRGHPARLEPREGLPSPVLGRYASARHDRHGARQRPRRAHRRRAHHRARRDHPGADHRAHGRAPAAHRCRDHHDHARPGRGRRHGRPHPGHVRRPVRSSTAPSTRSSTRRCTPTPGGSWTRCRATT